MKLPFRISDASLGERVISVDGAFDAPGLNLSHWPGNATPAALRRDLSTEIALAFARLSAREQAELAAGCVAIVNNHYDTDGVCAAFALLEPQLALARERELIDAAAAGDFFRAPSENAVAVDAVIDALADPARSPIAGELRDLSSSRRHQRAAMLAFEILPALLAGDLEPWRALWQPEIDLLRAGRATLADGARDELVHLDWTIWTVEDATPGRHALFGSTDADRVLVIAPGASGARYRFALSSLSWFEPVRERRLPRPDLDALAERLNELERAGDGANAWRAHATDGPTPELWFGGADVELYAEVNETLAESSLAPSIVRREIADALRAALQLGLEA